ncbi:MAG TPA: tetratricopeptide repeat protein [Steroidobacteraceae bacterium]|nr:tetratricopeptide repeat protein [Steroidobacteraceae bacterium]
MIPFRSIILIAMASGAVALAQATTLQATPPATTTPSAKPDKNKKTDAKAPPTPAEETPAAPDASSNRAGTYKAFRQQFDSRHFAEALVPARQLIEQTEQEFGPNGPQLVNPLINLGTTQLRVKDYSGAETSYKRAVKIVESNQGGFSHEIIQPLFGLGMTYAASGDYAASTDALKRAVDVSRKIDGLFNPAQLELLDPLIAGYSALNQYDDAQREQQYALRLAETTYGRDDPRILPALERTASWLESQGRFTTARQIHARALDIARKGGETDMRMISPLRGIARTYRMEFLYGPERPEGSPENAGDIGGVAGPVSTPASANGVSTASVLNPDGENALEAAMKIYDAHPGEDNAGRGQTLIELGDWRITAGQWRQAMNTYRDAWKALSEPGAPGTAALDSPYPVIYRAPSITRPPHEAADKYTPHYAEIEFTVTPEGRVRDAKLGDHDSSDTAGNSVLSAIKRARYRPRFVNGEPVETVGVRYKETIYVRS